MPRGTSGKSRIALDPPDRIRRAFNIFAACEGLSISEAFEYIVEAHMQRHLKMADDTIAKEKSGKLLRLA
jgi:hypothetical protein